MNLWSWIRIRIREISVNSWFLVYQYIGIEMLINIHFQTWFFFILSLKRPEEMTLH